jgi:hypothetical protein
MRDYNGILEALRIFVRVFHILEKLIKIHIIRIIVNFFFNLGDIAV